MFVRCWFLAAAQNIASSEDGKAVSFEVLFQAFSDQRFLSKRLFPREAGPASRDELPGLASADVLRRLASSFHSITLRFQKLDHSDNLMG